MPENRRAISQAARWIGRAWTKAAPGATGRQAIAMKAGRWLPCVLAALAIPCAASAQSLRCEGTLVSTGDTRLRLLRTCGPPTLSDQFCVRSGPQPPVYLPPYGYALPPNAPCVQVEELLYERAPGDLPAVVRTREGRIISIQFGRARWSGP